MLPQFCPLEAPAADTLWVSPKRVGAKRRYTTLPRGASPQGFVTRARKGHLLIGVILMAVFVLDKKKRPLAPCSEKRARKLLECGRGRVHSIYPFTIRIIDRLLEDSVVQPINLKIDPGSKTTGMALVREEENQQVVISLVELSHRGDAISKNLTSRASLRRNRRSKLRYRSPRFNNRVKKEGWLAPSVQQGVDNILTWVRRFKKRAPITSLTFEKVRFDTQKLQNPEIEGVEYQQGTLFGYEVKEYLLEKWGRTCAYCNAKEIPLQIDHIVPKSKGGSNRVDNLTLACESCNLKKSNYPLEIFSPKNKKVAHQASFKHAAKVNSARNALGKALSQFSLPVEEGTGGQTKYNRMRLGIPKTHALDAACIGNVIHLTNWNIPTLKIHSVGRGSYQRTRVDSFGFPRGYLTRKKRVDGFQTGDHVKAEVPSGKKEGSYRGRVAIRATGSFNIQTVDGVVQGISSKNCKLIQRADGYHYLGLSEKVYNIQNQPKREQRFPPALKGQVSTLSRG